MFNMFKTIFGNRAKSSNASRRRPETRRLAAIEALESREMMSGAGATPSTPLVEATIPIPAVYCSGGGQLCNNSFETTIETDGVLRAQYVAPGSHCSAVRIRLRVDGQEQAVSGFVNAVQPTAEFDLGPVTPGEHVLEAVAEGQTGGCNYGRLLSWAGQLNVTTSKLPHGDIAAVRLAPGENGVNYEWKILNEDLPEETTVTLFWAKGPTLEDRLQAIDTRPSGTEVDVIRAAGVPTERFANRPKDATHLLLAVDPDDQVVEPVINNVQALDLATDIALSNARYVVKSNQFHMEFDWTVTDRLARLPFFMVTVYRSTDSVWDLSDTATNRGVRVIPKSANDKGSSSIELLEVGYDANRPYLLLVANSTRLVSETTYTNNATGRLLPTVKLTAPGETTLLRSARFLVDFSEAVKVSEYRVEAKRKTVPADDWTKLVRSKSNAFLDWKATIAGELSLLAAVKVGRTTFLSDPVNNPLQLEVQFPTVVEVSGHPDVQRLAAQLWFASVTGATPDGKVQEYGGVIQVDTKTGRYGLSGSPTRPIGKADACSETNSKISAQTDAVTMQDYRSSGVYNVASIHTHPPITFCDNPDILHYSGPSTLDHEVSNASGIPGLVIDDNRATVYAGYSPSKIYSIYFSGFFDRRHLSTLTQ